MNIHDFLTDDEIEDAPEDNFAAFVYLVRLAQIRFTHRLEEVDQDQQWALVEEARLGFTNVVLGLAKAYDIEPFASTDMPRASDFDAAFYKQFKADLDQYMTQLIVGNSKRTRRDSFQMAPKVKGAIRGYLGHIREQVGQADLNDGKRAKLLKLLADFEAALDKDRINVGAVARFAFELLSVSANVVALADSQTFQKLLMNVMQTAAAAKAEDDDNRRLPPIEPMKALSPPRQEERRRGYARESFSADLDGEIPF